MVPFVRGWFSRNGAPGWFTGIVPSKRETEIYRFFVAPAQSYRVLYSKVLRTWYQVRLLHNRWNYV